MTSDMRRALAFSEESRTITPPEPWVGCVLVAADGTVLAEACNSRTVSAVEAALGRLVPTLLNNLPNICYLTLEPCGGGGGTSSLPSLSVVGKMSEGVAAATLDGKALVAAGVTQVVVGLARPAPAAYRGVDALKRCGLLVTVLAAAHPDALAIASSLASYLHHQRTGRPFCVVQYIEGLDGSWLGGGGGGPAAAAAAQPYRDDRLVAERHRHTALGLSQAVVLGSKTAACCEKEPWFAALQPDTWVVVVSATSHCATLPWPLWQHPRCLLLCCARAAVPSASLLSLASSSDQQQQANGGNVTILYLGSAAPQRNRSHPATLLDCLGRRGILQCCLLGGPQLLSAFLSCGVVDEIQRYETTAEGGRYGGLWSSSQSSPQQQQQQSLSRGVGSASAQQLRRSMVGPSQYRIVAVQRLGDEALVRYQRQTLEVSLEAAVQQLRVGGIVCVVLPLIEDDDGDTAAAAAAVEERGGLPRRGGKEKRPLAFAALVASAELVTPATYEQIANQSALHTVYGGLEETRSRLLQLPSMIFPNEEVEGTNYLCSVQCVRPDDQEAAAEEEEERLVVVAPTPSSSPLTEAVATLRALAKVEARASDFQRPGLLPLIAAAASSLEQQRCQPTDLAVTLCERAGFYPPVACWGRLAAASNAELQLDPERVALLCRQQGWPLVEATVLWRAQPSLQADWGATPATTCVALTTCELPLSPSELGVWTWHTFAATNGSEPHHVLTLGAYQLPATPCRVQSLTVAGFALRSALCDAAPRLEQALRSMALLGRGLLVLLANQDGRGHGTVAQAQGYRYHQQQTPSPAAAAAGGGAGFDAYTALGYALDERDFSDARRILITLLWGEPSQPQQPPVRTQPTASTLLPVTLWTRNPRKIQAIQPVEVCDRVPSFEPGTLRHSYVTSKWQHFEREHPLPKRIGLFCTLWQPPPPHAADEKWSSSSSSDGGGDSTGAAAALPRNLAITSLWLLLRQAGHLVAMYFMNDDPQLLLHKAHEILHRTTTTSTPLPDVLVFLGRFSSSEAHALTALGTTLRLPTVVGGVPLSGHETTIKNTPIELLQRIQSALTPLGPLLFE